MPYIPSADRERLNRWLVEMPSNIEPGEGAFVLTRIMRRLQGGWGRYGGFFSAALLFGVVVLTTLEYFRRVIVPYEDGRISLNGDVF